MEFKVDSQEFKKILTTCIKGYNHKEDSSYVLFEIDKKKRQLNVKCRSNTTLFRGSVPLRSLTIEDDDLVEYSVDGVTLKQILSVLPDTPVSIDFSIRNSIVDRVFTIKFPGISKVKLNIESMPLIHKEEKIEFLGEISADEFSHRLNNSLKLTSNDLQSQDSPQSAVHMFFDKTTITMMGTNTIVLGEFKLEDFDYKLEDPFTLLIKHQQASLLMKNVEANEVFRLVKTPTMFGYIDKDEILSLVSVVDMAPVKYEFLKELIVREDEIIIDKNRLKETLDIFSKLSPQDAYVRIFFSKADKLKAQVFSDNEDVFDLPLVNQLLTEDVTLIFSKSALLSTLQIINKEVKLIFKAENSQASVVKFESLNEDNENEEKVFLAVATTPDATN